MSWSSSTRLNQFFVRFQMIFFKPWLVVSLAIAGNPLAREIVEFVSGDGA